MYCENETKIVKITHSANSAFGIIVVRILIFDAGCDVEFISP